MIEIHARLRDAFLAVKVEPTRLLGSLEHVFDIRLSRLAFVADYRAFISVIGISCFSHRGSSNLLQPFPPWQSFDATEGLGSRILRENHKFCIRKVFFEHAESLCIIESDLCC